MARPRKPADLKQGKSESKEALKIRAEEERRLSGGNELVPEIPEHLDALAQEYYAFIVQELEVSKVLSNLDIPLLEQTADCLSKMRQADEFLNRDGIIIEQLNASTGEIVLKEHPAVVTKHKYLSQFRALSTQLGLSPASRAQLAGLNIKKKEDDEDPVLKLLRGGK